LLPNSAAAYFGAAIIEPVAELSIDLFREQSPPPPSPPPLEQLWLMSFAQ
jgi:hypothetical protein